MLVRVIKREIIKDLYFFKWDLVGGRTVLFRWAKTDKNLFLDIWDTKEKQWRDNPAFMEVTGNGGSSDYDRITEEELVKRLTPSLGKKAATKAILSGIY